MPGRAGPSTGPPSPSPAPPSTISRAGIQRMSVSHRSSNSSFLRPPGLDVRERDVEHAYARPGTFQPTSGSTGNMGRSASSQSFLGVSMQHPIQNGDADHNHHHQPSFSDTSDNIRSRTAQLSNLFSPQDQASSMRRTFSTASTSAALHSPPSHQDPSWPISQSLDARLAASDDVFHSSTPSSASFAPSSAGLATPKPNLKASPPSDVSTPTVSPRPVPSPGPRHPSALSLLIARQDHNRSHHPSFSTHTPEPVLEEVDEEAIVDPASSPLDEEVREQVGNGSTAPHDFGLDERTPLLRGVHAVPESVHGALTDIVRVPPWKRVQVLWTEMKKGLTVEALRADAVESVRCLPAVMLGLLLNILDGVSYGMIIFPTHYIFNGFGPIGVSMFFMTTIIAQLTYSLGGSMFAGGNGSMMIEVVPFFNILTYQIIDSIGEDDPRAVVATTLVAFALSSILTGLVFLFLGAFRLGALIGFFPRHILVGCIGGIGWFLIETGFEVAGRLGSEGFSYTWPTFAALFLTPHTLALWTPALGLAIAIRLITYRWDHQLILPVFFLLVPVVFYGVVAVVGVKVGTLREQGWVFDVGKTHAPWWAFYTYFDFRVVSWYTLWITMPTQLALLFFNILHPPLNVPALGVSLGEDDLDTDKELVAHGFSNIFAGIAGTVPNYLVYVNTLMFYRVGGGSRISGLFLAVGTGVLLVIGTEPIGYIPIMVVGALIFVLGIDLVKEAVWDTRNRVSMAEYFQIVAIILAMTIWDFVVGVFVGIVLSCFFFVVQSSRRRSVRDVYSGAIALSTVRRPTSHRAFLRKVGVQTCIMKLQGFLFFGTISYVEDQIRQLLDAASWHQNPIRFLILDFALVHGLDFSSGEALVRVHRLLTAKHVILVLCGCSAESPVGKSLQNVGLWTEEVDGVEIFSTLNEALEWTENMYLRAWLRGPSQKIEHVGPEQPIDLPGRVRAFSFDLPFENSPRHRQIMRAGDSVMTTERSLSRDARRPEKREPFNTLMKVFGSYDDDLSHEFFLPLAQYFKPVMLEAGTVLWNQDDDPDGIYIIESGVLKATYRFYGESDVLEESMVGGTIMGELSGLSATPRNATVVAERNCDLWRLSLEDLERMEKEQPETAHLFIKLVLRVTKTEYDALIAACAKQ